METEYQHYAESLSGFSSDEDYDFPIYSSDEENGENRLLRNAAPPVVSTEKNAPPMNLIQMLLNRERTGHFSGSSRAGQPVMNPFNKVPNRLSFCLKDIVDHRFLIGHVFMGLTACGQFLLSYKVCCNDNVAANHYSFNVGYKYTLFFWEFQPHKPLRRFFQCCLFDDHGVDNIKEVKMTQWKNADPRLLIVHGAPIDEVEDSYITYVKVPKLGCLECKKLHERDENLFYFRNALCLNCNLTVHTKYSPTETDPKFDPHINLLCAERILIIANGFMHMLRIDVDMPVVSNTQIFANTLGAQHQQQSGPPIASLFSSAPNTPQSINNFDMEVCSSSNQNNVIASILADFSDIETEQQNNTRPTDAAANISRKSYEDMIFTCNISGSSVNVNGSTPASSGSTSGSTATPVGGSKRKRYERIVKKSLRNSAELQSPATTSSQTSNDKSSAYEFSEDNEKCEKFSTLRKRRLADKKYEFSEDNSENIIPFTKIRSAGKISSLAAQLFTASPGGSTQHSTARNLLHFSPIAQQFYHNSPCASPSSSPHPSSSGGDTRHYTPPPPPPANVAHLGFRSPPSCASPASSSFMRSPSRHGSVAQQMYNQKSPPLSQATQQMLSFKPLGALSPLQVSMAKRMEFGGSMSPNAGLSFLSPRREEQRVVEVPLQGGTMPEKPICTKKLRRRYVEEDDATSVITSEEDDCISPGYHTSLPMEVHGSSYSEMQMISQASYQRLRCASVVITQHSFDLETFTYYVISSLCQKNQKTYDVFYDWAYEIINVCPLSHTVSCLLMAQFSARDQLPTAHTNCLNCSGNFDCAFHRRQYECRILFIWNMESGEWQVLDYGELKEIHDLMSPIKRSGIAPLTFAQQARNVALEMAANLDKLPEYTKNLRVHGSDIRKSKKTIIDYDNMIELCLKRRTASD